jgi:hypothetical protein
MERSLVGNTPELRTKRESNLDSLKHYSRLKFELATTIRSVSQLARRRNDDAYGVACQKLLARPAERFNLAVVGQFNRGKTSLMNALLGSDRLPTGVLPLTSVVTAVCYGDRERALIQLKDSSLRPEIPIEDLPRFVTENGNPGNTKQVVAKPEGDVARLLVIEQARVMETLAEDMQRYALNRDALRGQLATEEEWHAYKRGLSRLVGSRNLSKPWKAD